MARNLDLYDAKANESPASLSIAVVGDSNTMPLGVTDGWFDMLRKTKSTGRFNERGLGFRSLRRAAEWGVAGTRHATTVAYDKAPFGYSYRSTTAATISTYTVPAGETLAAGSRLLYIDTAGHGNPSYSINSGAWTTFGITPAADNGMKAITLPAVTTDVRVRGATAAGVDCQLDLWGIEVRNTQTSGVFWHNCAVSIHRLSGPVTGTRPLVNTTSSGDTLAWLDFFDPDLLLVAFVNDGNNTSPAATLDPCLQTLISRQKANGGDVLVVRYPEVAGTGPSVANQDAIRDEFTAEAVENNCGLSDVYASFGPFATADANGYFQADDLHVSTTGHQLWADIVWKKLAQSGPFVRV